MPDSQANIHFHKPKVPSGICHYDRTRRPFGFSFTRHLRLIKGLDIFPVLAQQSIRELNLTGRTYEDVLDATSVAVFQEGYTAGFGADGDHLKTPVEVQMALDKGFTMITLGCSEYIHNQVTSLPAEEIEKQ